MGTSNITVEESLIAWWNNWKDINITKQEEKSTDEKIDDLFIKMGYEI